MAHFHLALDTSTSRPVAAVLREDQVIAEWVGPPGTQHNETLLAGIDEILSIAKLKIADMHYLDVGVGPGMFTGLRVGVATAKFLCEARGIPAVPVSSLLALMIGAKPEKPARIWALNDAKSQRVYALQMPSIARSLTLEPSEAEEIALTPEEAAKQMQSGDYLIGEGAVLFKNAWPSDTLLAPTMEEHIVLAANIGLIGHSRFGRGLAIDALNLEPRYLKTGQKYL